MICNGSLPCSYENSDGQFLAMPNFVSTMMPQFPILDDMVCLLYNSFFFCYDHSLKQTVEAFGLTAILAAVYILGSRCICKTTG
jgi:hypothetical protein